MKTMKWLLQREFWEHKGSMFWAPIVVGAAMVMFVGTMVAYGLSSGKMHFNENVTRVDGKIVSHTHGQTLSAAYNAMPANERQQIVDGIASGYLATSAPLFLMLSVVVFFYCLGALYDERRDRSILFWKSLPVSDQMTVLSKVLTAVIVAPVVTIAVATFTSVLLLLIGGTVLAFNGINLFGEVLSSSAIYLAPLQIFGLLPVYIMWALPTVGYLLMVSAWARSKVFLWAVGVPLIIIVVVSWVQYLFGMRLDTEWFAQHVLARGLTGLLPGVWLPMQSVDVNLMTQSNVVSLGGVFTQSWKTMASPHAWGGAIVGIAMIFAAMRLRRWKDEG
jgi:ABC-2 type transport system permease protein